MSELLEQLRGGGIVFTPNVDHVMKLQEDSEFYDVYQHADYRVCDSQVLKYVSNFLGTPIREKISGSDLFPAFYRYYQSDESVKIFLLGGETAEIAKNAKDNINRQLGREIVVGAYSPSFGFEKSEVECQEIVNRINASGATVLALGVGSPKQEFWIAQYRHYLEHVHLFFAIGATINFEAGSLQRSPKWMSQVGFEWLYRLLREPRRLWKRYVLSAIPFFWLIIKQKLDMYQNPWVRSENFSSKYSFNLENLDNLDSLEVQKLDNICQEQIIDVVEPTAKTTGKI